MFGQRWSPPAVSEHGELEGRTVVAGFVEDRLCGVLAVDAEGERRAAFTAGHGVGPTTKRVYPVVRRAVPSERFPAGPDGVEATMNQTNAIPANGVT